jgi:PAS domain S-box-containing protein
LAPPPIPTTDELLRVLVEQTAAVTGQEFFDALTRTLCLTLNANHVALSRLSPGGADRVETLSAFAGGVHQPSFSYALDATPCKNVLGTAFTHHPDRVAELFPDDQFFAETNTRSYIGVPLATPDRRPLGLLTLCHDHATHHLAHLGDVLTLFAGRAAAEISRLHAERALRDERANLEDRVRERTADLAAVTGHVPCILWQADAEGHPGWDEDVDGRRHLFTWRARIIDETAARSVLPLSPAPGATYWDAWNLARHPDDADTIFASTAQALIMGLASYSREFRCLDRAGQVHWLHEEIAVRRVGDGPARWQLFGVVTNVTARKIAELSLRESEQRFRAMADAAPVLIWVTDPTDRNSWFNKPWRDFIGPAAIERDIFDAWENALHPEDQPHTLRTHRANFAARVPFRLEYRLRRHDGQYRWFLDHAVPRFQPDGSFVGYLGSCVDITDRKRAELELAAVTGRVPCILWRAAGQAPAGWRDDPDARLGEFRWEHTIIDEGAAQRLLPIDVPPGMRYHDAWGQHLHPDDRAVVRRSTLDAILAGRPYFDREYRVTDRHGRIHWLHEDVFVEPRGADRWDLFGVVTDVTPHKLAELALRDSEARYDLAARAGRVGIWDWNLVTGAIYLSDNLKALLGYPPDFPLEHPLTWHEHLHPDDVRTVLQATRDHFDGVTPVYEIEVRRRHRDGSWRWFLSRGTATRDPDTGHPVRMIGSLTDITDRKLAEEALRASESRYALATTFGRVGIWEWHVPSDTIHLSDSLKAILGYAPEELDGMDRATWRTHVHPDDLSTVLAAAQNVLDGLAPGYELEVRRRHKDGSWHWLASRASLTRDPATGAPLRMTGVVTDITDRKRAEEALRASERRYALATEAGHVGVWEYDADAGSLYLSPHLCTALGYPRGELNSLAAWRALIHPDDLAIVLGVDDDPAFTRFDFEVRRRHADGSWRWFHSRGTITRHAATGRTLRITGTHTDVTDRRQAEDALRESQRRYALATDAGGVGIWEYDVGADALYLSPNLPGMLGYAPGEIPDMRAWRDLLHPDDRAAVLAANADPAVTTFESLVRRRHRDGSWRWLLSRGTKARDPATGRLTRITGIHTDVTDLERAQDALRESQRRYALATDAGRVGTWEYDVDADSLYLSPNLPPMLGYGAGDFPTFQSWLALVHPDDLPIIRTAMDDPAALDFNMEVRRRHADGSWRWLGSRGTMTRDPATGRLTRINGTFTDVTDRRRAEEALRTSESRYALATEAGSVGIWECDYTTGAVYISPKLAALQGYDPADLSTLDAWHALVHPDDRARVLAVRNDPAVTSFQLETRRRHRDGSWRWFLSRGTVAREPDTGRPLRLTGTLTDITDLKRAQDALADSERRYALATEAGHVGVWEYDLEHDFFRHSPNSLTLLGYRPDELTTLDAWMSLIHPDDHPQIHATHLPDTTDTFELEVRRQHRDGSWRWFLSRGTVARDPDTGAILRVTGAHTDITDLKRAQDALGESQRRYTLATEAAGVGIWDHDLATGSFYLSPNLRAMLGYAPDELATLDAWREILHPDDRASVLAHDRDCHDTTFNIEVRRRHKDGSWRWFLSRGTVAYEPATGRRTRITGVLADISDRKRADDALRASEEHFRTLLEQSPLATFIFSPDGDYLRSNQAAVDMYGFAPAELRDYNVFADPVLAGTGIQEAYRAARDGQRTVLPEAPINPDRGRLKGQTVWIRGSVYPLRDPATGRVHALVAINEDVTERKRVEEALRSSERRFRKLVEQSPLSTQFLAPDGTMRTANRAFERLFGVTVGQLAGYNVLADPQLAEKGVTPLLRRAFDDGEAATLPTIPYVPPFGDFAGQERWCAALIFPVKDAAGRVEEVVLVHHDVTEQKRAEDALRASEAQYRLAADSNRRLLLELDHRVRNNLAGLASLVSVMRTLAPSVDAFAAAIDARLRAMSHVHHLLSQSQGRDLDLRSLLTSFLTHSRNLSPHPTPVRLDGPAVPLPSHLALPLTLILSEFLTNSAKYGAHSSPAGSVSLTWSLTAPPAGPASPDQPSSSPHHLCLRWTESGGPTPDPRPAPSLGSTLIESFSTRELAGTCSLTYPPAGAAHTLTFPLP